MVAKVILILAGVLFCSNLFAAAGKITEVTGPTQVTRNQDKIEGKVDVGIEMDDTIETLKARVGITFEDGTRVQCTEFSKLVIDTFVYDPSTGKGKLGLKASLGTVRYASGLIAKNSRDEVKIKTPTASVVVRGTDFSLTVDEMGRSLIILLPSLAQFGPPVVGSIEVSNGLGTVVMTKAYQATMVASSNVVPSAPVLLNLEDETSVNNGLLLDTPKSVTQSAKEAKKAPVQISKDSSDDSSNKKGTKSESKAASSGNSNSQSTSVAQVDNTSTSSAPAEETQSAASTQPQEASATLASVSLDINKLQPEVNKSIIEAISTKVATVNATIASAIPTITLPTSTVNTGFTTDGTSAILYVNNSGVIFYKVKVDTNATFTVTDKDSTKEYPLNYGSKLKVNIIQR
jgi:hypothetical protein